MGYEEFLRCKQAIAGQAGFAIDPAQVNGLLKPHQRDAVVWAVAGGRRALFESFGLGKTMQQLEICRLVLEQLGGGRGLIVCPLGVRQEFVRDGAMLGIEPRFIRRADEASGSGVYLTNYESVRDGKLDPRGFDVVSLDEAAVLRGFGGTKTFREFMRLYEGTANYRFVATATPSPNDYLELLAYAAFLDVLDVGQAKTRFFKRDSEHADRLTLLPHMEADFWAWVASWALFLQRPSDLGYSDEGYELPPIEVVWHELPAAARDRSGFDRHGRGELFRDAAMGVQAAAAEKRDSLVVRVQQVVEVIKDARESIGASAEPTSATEPGIQGLSAGVSARLLPQDAGAEARADAGSGSATELRSDGGAVPPDDGCPGRGVCDLHSSVDEAARGSQSRDGRHPRTALPVVQHGARDARRRPDALPEGGGVPGPQFVVWCDLNEEQRQLEAALKAGGISCSSLHGTQDEDTREQLLADWRARRTEVFLSKPSMYGVGVNLQQCHRMVFAGITYKFSETIQAIHRIQRFQQTQPVRVDLIYTEAEREIRKRLEEKWRNHETLVARMTDLIREHGLSHESIAGGLRRSLGVERQEVAGEGYRLILNDSVLETREMESDGVGLIVTSVPFSTQYEYSPSYNDFGHNESNRTFWRQMDYLTPELVRVLQPGRVAAIHVKDRIVPGGINGLGFRTLHPFHAEAIAHYQSHGLAFLGMITVVTDVVRENNQTYRLGWTEQCKDGSPMGVGVPEYVLLLRKPPTDRSRGYADEPVTKSKDEYSLSRWQVDAHGFWRSSGNRHLAPEEFAGLAHAEIFRLFRDHNLENVYEYSDHLAAGEWLRERDKLPVDFMLLQPPSWHPDVWTDVARMRTLNMIQARKGKEQHLCPLQFDIVDRLVDRWSNPGDVVYDPFAGIMTVPYRAVKLGRVGIGVELNPVYWRDGIAHVESVARQHATPSLFDLEVAA